MKPENTKWLKLGAATVLSVGMLAACGDDNDTDLDVNNPPPADTDVDMDIDDTDDGM